MTAPPSNDPLEPGRHLDADALPDYLAKLRGLFFLHSDRAADAFDALLALVVAERAAVPVPSGRSEGFAGLVAAELARARQKHARGINSAHEGYAVIDEELEEFKRLVYGQDRADDAMAAMLEELVQVAAMAQRCAEDVFWAALSPAGPPPHICWARGDEPCPVCGATAGPPEGGEREALGPTTILQGQRARLGAAISAELERAYTKHGREAWGRHEFYAILLEEVEELWEAIKQDRPQQDVEDELVQVAAMCFRYFETGDRYRAASSTGEGDSR